MQEIDKLDKNGNSPLMIAAAKGDGAMVEKLLNDGADPTITDLNGAKACHRAKNRGHHNIAELLQQAENGRIKRSDGNNELPEKKSYEPPAPDHSSNSIPSKGNKDRQDVVITDIHMPFWSMVVFMVKWVIAAIPAFIILFILSLILNAIFGGFLNGIVNA